MKDLSRLTSKLKGVNINLILYATVYYFLGWINWLNYICIKSIEY